MENKQPSVIDLLIETHIGLERQGPGSSQVTQQALEFLKPLNQFSRIADLGCGTGEVMKLILQQDNSKILYGLDLSEKMLEIAQKKLENRATLILGDSEQLPFSDCFFDVVYCNDSFHHYPAPERVLSEIDRVLKPNGTFILCDCWQPTIGRAIMNFYMKYSKEGDVKIYSESEICKLLSRHFSNVTWERVGNTACMACGTK